MPLYLKGRTFEASFQTDTSTSRCMGAGMGQGGILSPLLFSMYVNDMPSPSRHVELALSADDTAVVAMSRQPALLVKYIENYFSKLERRVSEWRIDINVSKSCAILFAQTGGHIPKSRAVQLFGEPIQWVEDARYLGVTLDKRLTRSKNIDQVRKKVAQGLGPLQNRRSGLSIMNGVLLYRQPIRPVMDYACPVWWFAACSYIKKLQML